MSAKQPLSSSNHSLVIRDLTVGDGGTYQCVVKTPYEHPLEYSVELFVHGEPPKIISKFKQMTLHEGQDLMIPCKAKGVPLPSLSWLFNDKPAVQNDTNDNVTHVVDFIESKIFIPSITKMHEGVYQCEAENKYGSGVAKATVRVVHRTSIRVSM